jgi:uncharacterized C2H2 Zn-finger protein
MRLFRKKDEGKQENFRCKYCNTSFENEERLKRHTKKAHSEKDGNISSPNPFGGF